MQKFLSYLRRGVDDYQMINENDNIAVGVSGGKDSLALLLGLAKLKTFYPKKFDITAITLSMGFDGMDFSPVRKFCDDLGINYILKKTDIKEILFDIRKESNPCSLCAKMRRGALHDAAIEAGCRKVALGHHYDDVLETFMLCMIYEGRISCFSPVTYLDRKDITLIRPMIYAPESYIKGLVKREELPIVKNLCPMDAHTKREYAKDLIKKLEKENPGFRTRLFTAIEGAHAGDFGIFPDKK